MSEAIPDRTLSPAAHPKRRALWSARTRDIYFTALVMLAPALVGLGIFYYVPIAQAVRYSFYDYNLIAATLTWKGLANYQHALTDSGLANSVRVTLLFFLYSVPPVMVIGLALALFVQRPRRSAALLRTIILLPVVTSMVVVTTIWGFMYNPQSGLINSILAAFHIPAQNFLMDPRQSLPSIALMAIWKDAGFVMLFYLAGLMAIPEVYHEAARIDGASAWQAFRHITLPLLRGSTIFVLITCTISAFKVFVPVFMTTRGGPMNSTRVIVLYIYDNAFRFNDMGYAAAISVLLALLLVAVSLLQFVLTRERGANQRSAYGPNQVRLF